MLWCNIAEIVKCGKEGEIKERQERKQGGNKEKKEEEGKKEERNRKNEGCKSLIIKIIEKKVKEY